MTPIHIKLTEELLSVLARISDLRQQGTGPLIEALLRSHPAVDLVREELGVEWVKRTTRGWKLGVPRKKVLKPTRREKK
jgi:hypothetical protein